MGKCFPFGMGRDVGASQPLASTRGVNGMHPNDIINTDRMLEIKAD